MFARLRTAAAAAGAILFPCALPQAPSLADTLAVIPLAVHASYDDPFASADWYERDDRCQRYYRNCWSETQSTPVTESLPETPDPRKFDSTEWTDEKLYERYGLKKDEIAFIESMVRSMDNGNDDE